MMVRKSLKYRCFYWYLGVPPEMCRQMRSGGAVVTVRLKGAKNAIKLSQKQPSQVVAYRDVSMFDMGVSKNSGTPKSSILIGYSIINHPFWGTSIFWKHPYLVEANACIIFGLTF